jgi:chromate reductase
MAAPIRVLAVSGSLRKGSYNTALLRAAIEVAPEGITVEIFDISPIPLYNQDVEDRGLPASVKTFRERIAAADALLIATPEYNYMVPGVLKNALDWASRAPDTPLTKKPVAIMGASNGGFGTVRSQLHLRQFFVTMDMTPIQKPQVLVSFAQDKIDAAGRVVEEKTRDAIRDLLAALADLTRRLRR